MTESAPASRFFSAFQRNIAQSDVNALAAQFAETYLNGGPHGHQLLHSADLVAGLSRRRELLNSLGCGPSRLVSLTETPLGDRFILAQVRWQFALEGAEEAVVVDSTYILDAAEPVRILLYISHQDLMAILKARQREGETSQIS